MDRQKILIIAAIVVAILIIILSFGLKKDRNLKPITLEMWGVYDDQAFYEDLIETYTKKNKHITINYHEKTFANYEEELVNALAADKGPDIFSIHNTWLPKHKDKIKPIEQSSELLSLENFKNTFVDVVSDDFVRDNKIYAIPFYVDTLALYYNKDFFNSAGISSPPSTWEEFLEDTKKLTKKDNFGNIEIGGAAIGTAKNINRSTDILGLLMLQAGAKMTDDKENKATFSNRLYVNGESFTPGEDAFRFFTDFSSPTKKIYSWNRQMPYSIDAFYQGKVAMMLNYSHHIDTIKQKSPYLNFAVASAPQLKERKFDINYANYWGYAVSKNSTHQEEAWKFVLFLAEKNNLKKYLEKSKRPTARRDLIDWQRGTDLAIFANQALSARSWHQANNQAIETIMANMIESVVLGSSTIKKALAKSAAQVTILMK